MALPGERLIIAATLDVMGEGETFDELPPHMTVVRWFNLQESRRPRLTSAMDRLFTDKPVFRKAIGGRKQLLGVNEDVPVRLVNGIEMTKVKDDVKVNPQWFALHALIQSLGKFDEDDQFSDVFLPHISDTEAFALKYRQRPAFKSVAVFAKEGAHQDHRVVTSSLLGRK